MNDKDKNKEAIKKCDERMAGYSEARRTEIDLQWRELMKDPDEEYIKNKYRIGIDGI